MGFLFLKSNRLITKMKLRLKSIPFKLFHPSIFLGFLQYILIQTLVFIFLLFLQYIFMLEAYQILLPFTHLHFSSTLIFLHFNFTFHFTYILVFYLSKYLSFLVIYFIWPLITKHIIFLTNSLSSNLLCYCT